MILIQALLLAITANLASGRVWSPITWPFCYPLINGTIVGIILGNPLLGLTAGATINLAYIGWISAGGTMPDDSQGYLMHLLTVLCIPLQGSQLSPESQRDLPPCSWLLPSSAH